MNMKDQIVRAYCIENFTIKDFKGMSLKDIREYLEEEGDSDYFTEVYDFLNEVGYTQDLSNHEAYNLFLDIVSGGIYKLTQEI